MLLWPSHSSQALSVCRLTAMDIEESSLLDMLPSSIFLAWSPQELPLKSQSKHLMGHLPVQLPSLHT